jgi:hypothetical protein
MRRTGLHAGLLAAVAGALLSAGCVAAPPLVLEIGSPAGDGTVLHRTIRPGDLVTYRFVHSASRTPVEETWTVVRTPAGPGLRLRAVLYQGTGAGLPTGVEGALRRTAGGFALTGLDRPIDLPLHLRVTPAARNVLVVAGETIELTRLRDASGLASLLRLTLRPATP